MALMSVLGAIFSQHISSKLRRNENVRMRIEMASEGEREAVAVEKGGGERRAETIEYSTVQ